MRRWLLRIVGGVIAIAIAAVLIVTLWPSEEKVQLSGVFPDVMDLVTAAHVRTADVPIGTVTGIELTDAKEARVTMEVREGTGLPTRVRAVLKRTSLLGERYVELIPVEDAGGSLEDGGRIVETAVQSDLEDLITNGTDVFGAIAADRLASAITVGAQAFGGQGTAIGSLLADLEAAVGDYNEGRDEIVRLIDASDRLVTTLAEDAEVNARALEDLARASAVLEEEDTRLLDALEDLSRLSDVGAGILRVNRPSIDALITRFANIAEQLTRIDGALNDVLFWFRRHNLHVPSGVIDEQSQVWNDFQVCGETTEEDNPANSCRPPNPGRSNHPPPDYDADDCDFYHDGCPYPGDPEPDTTEQPGDVDGEPGDGGPAEEDDGLQGRDP